MAKEKRIKLLFSKGDEKLVSEFTVKDGDSDYDTYRSLPGNENKTEREFLESLKADQSRKITQIVSEYKELV